MKLAVLVPVLGRPQNVQPLLDSLASATSVSYRVLFLTDPDDHAEREAIRHTGAHELPVGGSYAFKINEGVRATSEPLLFLAADDLRPRPGWLEAALRRLEQGAEVVGLNDLIPRAGARREHATHFVITRAYAERPTIDGGRGPLCEVYAHNYVDDELIATATHRGVYAYASDALVDHLHPMVGQPDDPVYRRGRSTLRTDGRIFSRRMRLWT